MSMTRFRPFVLVFGLPLFSGCVPTGVTWLPDSSGFLFCESLEEYGHSRLSHYDLAKKAKRVVVENAGGQSFQPALSPDGKKVAVAHSGPNADKSGWVVGVFVYDLDGKELSRSPLFEWQGDRSVAEMLERKMPTQVVWPREDKMVVQAEWRWAIYDMAKRKMAKQENDIVAIHPEGRGILTRPKPDGKNDAIESLSFVDWDGWSKPIPVDPAFAGGFVEGRWEGQTAILVGETEELAVDIKQLTAKRRPLPIRPVANEKWIEKDGEFCNEKYSFPATSIRVGLVGHEGVEDRKASRLEVLNQTSGERRVIDHIAPFLSVEFFPSPDGNHVAVIYKKERGAKNARIVVIDKTGATVCELSVASSWL